MLELKQVKNKLHAIPAHRCRQGKIITLSSGKGGVGKTLSALYFTMFARQLGFNVLLINGSFGMSDPSELFGLDSKNTVKNIFDGTELSNLQKQIFISHMDRWKDIFDLILLDSSSGIGKNVMFLNEIAQHNIVVTTPEPHAISDAQVLIKTIQKELKVKKMDLLVNMTKSSQEGAKIASEISNLCEDRYGVKIQFIGAVPFDPTLAHHILRKTVASEEGCKSIAAQAFGRIIHRFCQQTPFVGSDDNLFSIHASQHHKYKVSDL